MRKIIAGEFISVDGVVEGADQLMGQYFSDEVGHFLGAGMANTEALLLGRVT